jgi:hypothetical protein
MTTVTITPQVESKLTLNDDGTPWEIGKPCLKAVASFSDNSPELLCGNIIFLYDSDAKKVMYGACGLDGTELFEATHSLPEMKRNFFNHKDELIAHARVCSEERALDPILSRGKNTESVPSPYVPEQQNKKEKVHERSIKRTPSAKGKSKGNSQTR